jgi:hypothetical protein
MSFKNKSYCFKKYDIEDLLNEIERSYLKLVDNLFILDQIIDNALGFLILKYYCQTFNNKHYEINVRDFGIWLYNQIKKVNAAEQFNREKREQQGLGLGLYLNRQLQRKQRYIASKKALLFQ